MEYFIGIDPSINSTGICIQKYDDNKKINEQFIIIKPDNKTKPKDKWLNKKEQIAEDKIFNFEYIFYDKMDLTPYKDMNHFSEYWKSYNMISCTRKIKEVIKEYTKDNPKKINIIIEGISYGSVQRTKSIFDLAGLNYLVREKFIEVDNITFTIVTPSEVKKFASGNGNCKKEIMVNLFLTSHPELNIIPKVDDISDAWFMSNYAKYIVEQC